MVRHDSIDLISPYYSIILYMEIGTSSLVYCALASETSVACISSQLRVLGCPPSYFLTMLVVPSVAECFLPRAGAAENIYFYP